MLRDIFNGMVIDRKDKNNVVQKEIVVPCVNGSRSRILKSLENRNKTLKLPIMALDMKNIRRDRNRVHSVNEVIQNELGTADIDLRLNTAVPLDLTFTLSAIGKYREDIDQIICNYMPFFNPDLYVSYPAPYNIGNINSQIIWDGFINMPEINSIDETTSERIVAETTFVMKIWVFPGIDNGVDYPSDKLIYKINFQHGQICNEITSSSLSGFYDVPYSESFVDYQEKIENGDIKYPEFDILQVPAPNDPECIEEVEEFLTDAEKYLLLYPHCDHNSIVFKTNANLDETVSINAVKNGDEEYVWDWGDGRARSIGEDSPTHNYIDGKKDHSIYLYNITYSNLTSITASNSLIYEATLGNYVNLESVVLDNNLLRSIDIVNLTNLTNVILNNNTLSSVNIDAILEILDLNGLSNGTLDYSNNIGELTITNKPAYDNLISKGWNIIGAVPVAIEGFPYVFPIEFE